MCRLNVTFSGSAVVAPLAGSAAELMVAAKNTQTPKTM